MVIDFFPSFSKDLFLDAVPLWGVYTDPVLFTEKNPDWSVFSVSLIDVADDVVASPVFVSQVSLKELLEDPNLLSNVAQAGVEHFSQMFNVPVVVLGFHAGFASTVPKFCEFKFLFALDTVLVPGFAHVDSPSYVTVASVDDSVSLEHMVVLSDVSHTEYVSMASVSHRWLHDALAAVDSVEGLHSLFWGHCPCAMPSVSVEIVIFSASFGNDVFGYMLNSVKADLALASNDLSAIQNEFRLVAASLAGSVSFQEIDHVAANVLDVPFDVLVPSHVSADFPDLLSSFKDFSNE